MAEDGAQRGDRHSEVGSGYACPGGEPGSQHHGGRALARIEEQSQGSQQGRLARDIGRADVPAAALAHVFAVKDADEEIAERDGPEKVTGGGDEEDVRHALPIPGPGSLRRLRWAKGPSRVRTGPAWCTSILSARAGSGTEKTRGPSCYQTPGWAARRVFPAGGERPDWGRLFSRCGASPNRRAPAPESGAG